jgi:O-methyltransferase
MKRLIKKIFASAGYDLRRAPAAPSAPAPPPPTMIVPWHTDEKFVPLYNRTVLRTLVSIERCHILYQLALQAAGQPGDVAEIGVYRGGKAYLLAKTIATGKNRLHLFDTFEGMPPTDRQKDPFHHEGNFSDTSLESVKEFLSDCDNVAYYPGFFPETATPVASTRFSLVHVDADIYKSVHDCCSFFYDRLLPGGFMVFDDYGFLRTPGSKEAVDDFFLEKPEYPCYLPTGQCLVVKAP